MMKIAKLKLLYQNRLAFLGTGSIIISLFLFLPTALTFENMLIPLKGTIKSSNSYSQMILHKERFNSERFTRSSTLIFSLNEFEKTFIIEAGSQNPLYNGNTENDKIASYLEGSNTIIVWIKIWDKKDITPEIFKIDIDGRNEYDYKPKRLRAIKIMFFLVFFGLFCIYVGDKIEKTKAN